MSKTITTTEAVQWKVGDSSASHARVTDSNGNTIAECPKYGAGFFPSKELAELAPWKHATENAFLIACAPELLQILEVLLKMYEDGDVTTVELDEARAIIRKAKGQP